MPTTISVFLILSIWSRTSGLRMISLDIIEGVQFLEKRALRVFPGSDWSLNSLGQDLAILLNFPRIFKPGHRWVVGHLRRGMRILRVNQRQNARATSNAGCRPK